MIAVGWHPARRRPAYVQLVLAGVIIGALMRAGG